MRKGGRQKEEKKEIEAERKRKGVLWPVGDQAALANLDYR